MSSALPWLTLMLLTFLVYLPALGAGFVWDDDSVTKNPLVTSFTGFWKIWTSPGAIPGEQHYWPLTYSTFWLEHWLFGLKPAVFHFNNILLHAVCVLLLWRVLLRLGVPGAWLAAALFAVHPVHAESVAWIIERKDVLSGALYLGATLAYLRFDDLRSGKTYRIFMFYGFALALFALALLSKSIVVTLPVALAAVLWLCRGRLTRRDLIPLVPLAVLAALLTLLDLHFYHRQQQSGAQFSGLAFPERLQMAGRAAWFYLAKLAWPYPLATFYPPWPVGRTQMTAWLPLLAGLGLLAGLWAARRRIGRGPCAAAVFFIVTLAPALGLVDFDFLYLSWVADRFQYLASAGPLALAAALFKCGMRNAECGMRNSYFPFRIPREKARWAWAFETAFIILLAVLGLLTWRQASHYRNTTTLFRANIAAYPHAWSPYMLLGLTRAEAGQGDEAVRILAEGLTRMPKPECRLTLAMAQMLDRQQRFAEAEQYYQETLRINPAFTEGRFVYGAFLALQGRLDEGVAQYQEALRLNPGYGAVMVNLGHIRLAQGDGRAALAEAERALRLQPHSTDALLLQAQAYEMLGDAPRAAAAYRAAQQSQPDQR